MKRLKKNITLLFTIFMFTLLTSCTSEEGGINDYINNNTTPTNSYEKLHEDVELPFTGDLAQLYEFLWLDNRDRGWERDIVYFAQSILRNHPLLNPQANHRLTRGNSSYRTLLNLALARNEIPITGTDDYDIEALRVYFICRVNALILDIPERSDYEIKYGIAEISALLADLHTSVMIAPVDIFPFRFIALYDGIYCISAPIELEKILYRRLISINGIEVDEIIERFSRVVSHENEYRLRHRVAHIYLSYGCMLRYIDVATPTGTTVFTFSYCDYETICVEVMPLYIGSLPNIESVFYYHEIATIQHCFADTTLMHLHYSKDFWFYYFADCNMVYARIRSFERFHATEGDLFEAINEFNETVNNLTQYEKVGVVIIDLRGNPGGQEWHLNPALLDSDKVGTIYVLVDGASVSASIVAASTLRHSRTGVYVVGEPAGQPESFFAFGGSGRSLPISGLRFRISNRLFSISDCDYIALKPDILIFRTINDIIYSHDPVLEALK